MVLNTFLVIVILFNFINRSTSQLNTTGNGPKDYIEDWFNEVTDESIYQKWKKPPTVDGIPTYVNMSIHLYTLAFLDEVTTVSV